MCVAVDNTHGGNGDIAIMYLFALMIWLPKHILRKHRSQQRRTFDLVIIFFLSIRFRCGFLAVRVRVENECLACVVVLCVDCVGEANTYSIPCLSLF